MYVQSKLEAGVGIGPKTATSRAKAPHFSALLKPNPCVLKPTRSFYVVLTSVHSGICSRMKVKSISPRTRIPATGDPSIVTPAPLTRGHRRGLL